MLTPIWIAQMISDVSLRIPGDTYAVYIMDLAIVFPAFVISSFLLIKKNGFGIVLGGMSLIKIITLCLSWTFGEWTRPVTGNPVDLGMASISALLCFIGIILFLIYVNAVIKAEPVGIQN